MSPSHSLLLSLWIALVRVYSQYNYTNFKEFGIKLPSPLQQHISAVYNNKLYVFGGLNTTALIDVKFSRGFWSLDLSQVNLVLSATNNDIDTAQLNLAVQWEELTVTPPSYGPAVNGIIRCIHQCSVLVGKYLYIAAPIGESTGQTTTMYRLDLSVDPPVYAASSDFASSLLFSVAEPCITATNDGQFIYMVGGNKFNAGSQADKDLTRYTVSTDEWTTLQFMNQHRQSAGCGVSYNDEEVYIFGGRSDCDAGGTCSTFTGSTNIDTYNVDTDTWTNNGYGTPELPQPTFDIKCVNNVYDETIICPGGIAQRSWSEVIIYKTPTKDIIDTIDLWKEASAYGMVMHEFVNDGNDEARILFVIGGSNGDLIVYDEIQYLVIYNVPTVSPTSTPSEQPTATPSNAPTSPPTMAPSNAPTQPPSSAPTFTPTKQESTAYVTRAGTAQEKQTEVYGQDISYASSKSITVVMVIYVVCFVVN